MRPVHSQTILETLESKHVFPNTAFAHFVVRRIRQLDLLAAYGTYNKSVLIQTLINHFSKSSRQKYQNQTFIFASKKSCFDIFVADLRFDHRFLSIVLLLLDLYVSGFGEHIFLKRNRVVRH